MVVGKTIQDKKPINTEPSRIKKDYRKFVVKTTHRVKRKFSHYNNNP